MAVHLSWLVGLQSSGKVEVAAAFLPAATVFYFFLFVLFEDNIQMFVLKQIKSCAWYLYNWCPENWQIGKHTESEVPAHACPSACGISVLRNYSAIVSIVWSVCPIQYSLCNCSVIVFGVWSVCPDSQVLQCSIQYCRISVCLWLCTQWLALCLSTRVEIAHSCMYLYKVLIMLQSCIPTFTCTSTVFVKRVCRETADQGVGRPQWKPTMSELANSCFKCKREHKR